MMIEAALLAARLRLFNEMDESGRAELAYGLESFIPVFNC